MSLDRPCVHWNDGYCQKFSDNEVQSWCVEGPCEYEQPSHADRIRAMSDEELAELFGAIIHKRELIIIEKLNNQGIEASLVEAPGLTFNVHLEWLKQPAEETNDPT